MVNSRWLRNRKSIFGLFLLANLISCTNQQMRLTSTPTNAPSSSATIAISPTSTKDSFPPKETPQSITPVAFDANTQNLNQIIDSTYHVPLACKLDWLDSSRNPSPYNSTPDPKAPPTKLDFVDITKQVDLNKVWIHSIADSTNKKYRAYLVDEPIPDKCDTCIRSAIYIESQENKLIYRIDFQGYQPNRVLYGLSWIGEQVITFAQNDSPYYDDLFGINVESKNYVYLASFPRCTK